MLTYFYPFPVLREFQGGYMAAKVSKLDEQFRLDAPREKQKEGACSGIFRGVAIYVNGYTGKPEHRLL